MQYCLEVSNILSFNGADFIEFIMLHFRDFESETEVLQNNSRIPLEDVLHVLSYITLQYIFCHLPSIAAHRKNGTVFAKQICRENTLHEIFV